MRAMPYQPALAAFAASLVCLAILLTPFGRRLMLDRPNARSLHEKPVPRSGGIAIAAGVAAGAVLAPDGLGLQLALAGALAAVSLADDLLDLPTLVRLATHLGAAAAVLALQSGIANPGLLVVLALAVAWSANLYNFMDGADGLAGGMAVFGFGAYAIAGAQAGLTPHAEVSAAIAAASAAFLLFNFAPARIFMGDVGSVPLGFLAGTLGIVGWHEGAWPLWFPMLVFAPFACDATLTLLKRFLRRERVWQAHREHYYQRLVRMGFGHRGTALIEYTTMAACAATALLARTADAATQLGAVVLMTLALVAVAVWIDLRWARYRRDSQGAPA
jgi:UDP-N-acetylmuramyl pentapeptide phosphotransferase/UDP-N-acetylglucosamine-1-phosphate transferase